MPRPLTCPQALTVECPDCGQSLPLRVTVRRLPLATSAGDRVVTIRTTPYQHYCRGGVQ